MGTDDLVLAPGPMTAVPLAWLAYAYVAAAFAAAFFLLVLVHRTSRPSTAWADVAGEPLPPAATADLAVAPPTADDGSRPA